MRRHALQALSAGLACPVIAVRAQPLPCQPASVEPNWPIFHIVNNISRGADGTLKMRPLNDANAVFSYKGVYHVMNQAGGGTWTHAVSKDLAHWAHIPDALGPGPQNSSWDHSGPCDGTASFPVGPYGFDGSVPIIMYGPDCAQPIPPSGVGLGDAPRVEPAVPADPSDAYLRDWVKTQPGPVTFDGTPCSFPGRVWKSKNGNYYNMLCALDGKAPWARYTSTHPELMHWKMANPSFTSGADKGADAGALFHKVPGSNGLFMINTGTGEAFLLGTYDSVNESMTVTSGPQVIESGHAYHWAAIGNNGPDPETDEGRVLTVAWVSAKGGSVLSSIRSVTYDAKTSQLVAAPVAELSLLRNATYVEHARVGPIPSGGSQALDIPPGAGGTADVHVSFDPAVATSVGLAVRAPASGANGAALLVSLVQNGDLRNAGGGTAGGNFSFTAFFNGAGSPPFTVLRDETLDVRVLVDRPIVEVFVNGGRAAFTFADDTYSPSSTSVHVLNGGPAPVTASNVSVYGMGCGWYAD